MSFSDYFSVQVFFLVFRETLETAVIVSVLLSFLKQGFGEYNKLTPANKTIYDALFRHVWLGAVLGLAVCVVVGGVFIVAFQLLGKNLWNSTEKLWESFFCILASVMITFMGLSMMRLTKMKSKWRLKLARAIVESNQSAENFGPLATYSSGIRSRVSRFTRKYSMALLPMITTMREGLEAIALVGGLGASQSPSSLPLTLITALSLGTLVGMAMYSYGTQHSSIKVFILGATCFLYLVSAGLFSRGVWFFEMNQFIKKVGSDVSETGSGPGSYDISRSVWHVNCCNPETDGPWIIFNGLLGWQNSATYGSVTSYCLYWLVVSAGILRLLYTEKRKGHSGSSDEETRLISQAAGLMGREGEDAAASA